jgi:hypothetical protein
VRDFEVAIEYDIVAEEGAIGIVEDMMLSMSGEFVWKVSL